MSTEFKRTEHSDIIVHWTGKDIDARDPKFLKTLHVAWRDYCLRPIEQPSLIEEPTLIEDYVNRLRNILKFGLWMTNDRILDEIKKESSHSKDDGRVYEAPNAARVCFTELKLSESRRHAFEFGRLGIGMKRMFLLERAGQPMIYVGETKGHGYKPNWFFSREARNDTVTQFNEVQKSFFKFTSELEDLNYKYYSETEWRIAYSNSIPKDNHTANTIIRYFIDINGNLDCEANKYKNINQISISRADLELFIKMNQGKRLKFLVPLDYWLAIIIYPCPAVRAAAEQDNEIRKLIKDTRYQGIDKLCNLLDSPNKDSLLKELAKLKVGEKYMMPMEIDLDTISHF